MITYEAMTVGDLMDWLVNRSPDETIGLSTDTGSYRGYYEHVYVAPGSSTCGELARTLRRKLRTTMQGYKGGDYTYDTDCKVFVAEYGDTGPFLAGFNGTDPVVVEDSWF